jgi:branched-chain amino acid transport system substrate-binding protein
MLCHVDHRAFTWLAAGLAAAAYILSPAPGSAESGDPIKIGYAISLTGPLAPNGKSAALAQKIWEDDTNARGGLLGRAAKLIVYDDQSNPATIPGIYTKLLDADKVELVNGPYGTNAVAPALLIAMQRGKLLVGLLALGVNTEFNYPRYFSMTPNGPNPKAGITKGFFDIAMAQTPTPQTVAIVGRRRRVFKECRGRCPRERGHRPAQDRLRQDLSAQHQRLCADRAGDRRGQSGCRRDLLVSARFGRHGAGHQ